jgi:hypothetical protein
MSTLVGIKYVGKKNRPQPDTVAGSKFIWAGPDDVQFVPDSIASRLLKHPDVWAVTGETKSDTSEDISDLLGEEKKLDLEQEQPPLVPLDTMSKKELIHYAQVNFGQKLVPQMSEATMRAKVRSWVNSPMMAG